MLALQTPHEGVELAAGILGLQAGGGNGLYPVGRAERQCPYLANGGPCARLWVAHHAARRVLPSGGGGEYFLYSTTSPAM